MATPSVLTVPSMYGDGILYSGPTVFGNQIITNGDFSQSGTSQSGTVNATSWTLGWQSLDSGISIANGNLILARGTGDCRAYATDGSSSTSVVTSGKRYKLTYTVTENPNNASLFYHTGAAYVSTSGGVGTHVAYYTAAGTIFILRNNTNNSTIKIDNVSLKEITQGSDFEFNRATTGTRINEEGYIEDVPYNLIQDSEDFDGNWGLQTMTVEVNKTISPKNTFKGGLITTGGTTPCLIRPNSLSLQIGQTYTFSVFVKKENTSSIRWIRLAHVSSAQTGAWFDLDNIAVGTVNSESATIVDAGNGWYRIANTFVAYQNSTFNSVFIAPSEGNGLTDAGPATLSAFIWGAQVVKGNKTRDYLPTTDTVNLPRLNYPVYGGCPSILVEPQRTNEVTHSQDFTNGSWNKSFGITVTSNQAISPEGIQSADKLIIDNGTFTLNGGLYIQRIGVVNQDVSFSVFAKAGEFRYGTISYGSTNANGFHFDLKDGIILSTFTNTSNYTNIGYEMIAYPNGWYKLVVNTTEKNANNRFIGIRPNNTIPTATNNNYSSTGNGSSGIFVYGAQLEVGSYTTSLIHTKGSTVTRNEDQTQNSGVGTTNTFNSSEGVLYAEVENLAEDGQNKCISINDGSANNRVTIVLGTATNQIRAHVLSGGGAVFDEDTFTVPTSTQFNKIAVKYKANDFSMFVDGIKVASDSSGAAPVGLGQLDLDVGNNSLRYFGNVKGIAVYKTALTDTELANLTSYNNHDLFIPYRSRMQMIGADQELQCTEHDITRFL